MSDDFKYDVFLSHSAKDNAVVLSIAEQLRENGLKVWLDDWEIQAGDCIPAKIEDGLVHSRILVLCISKDAQKSDWAKLESYTFRFRDPLNNERHFIPLRLDDAPVKGLLSNFSCINWFLKERGKEFLKLLAACRGELGWTPARQRICMISSEYPPFVLGGLGVHVTRLSTELAAFADVDLVLPHRRSAYTTPPIGVRTHALSRVEANYDDPVSWLHFSQHAFDLVERLSPKPEVVHCHDWVTVPAGIKCRWRLNIPLIFHVHLPNRTPFCASVENLGIVCADLVTVNSQAMAEQLRGRFPEKKVVVVPNGVDTSVFKPRDTPNNPDRCVLFVGRLVEQKGVDHLLRAFVHVLKRFPDCRLKIVGSGPCDLPYQRLADCLLIADNVEFLGWKTDEEVSLLYQSATVVAIPSVYEPFGMTALEAMACARPVVASNTDGLKEIICHEETGCLVEPRDHLGLAQWLITLLDQPNLRQKLAVNAGHTVHACTQYQWSSIARRYAEFYYKLSSEQLDRRQPKEASDYISQIRDLACGLDSSLKNQFPLFSWLS